MSMNSINSSMLRLTGLQSGLETDMIVQSMLQLNQARVDKQNQLTTKLTWKADSLREINSMIRSFRDNNLSARNASTNMLSAAAYNTFSVSMLTSTNAVSVSAGSNANVGRLTINNISQLATQASMKGDRVFEGETLSMNTALKELSLNNAFEFEEGVISFSINGETFTFSEDATLNNVLNTINSSDAGVRMSYSNLTKGFAITAKTTGSASQVEIVNLTGNAFASENSAFGISEGTENGKNAKLMIEGIAVERSSNTFTIDGITYTLKDEMTEAVSFSVNRNLDATVDKIVSFVDAYNNLIDKIQSMISEKTYRNYPPLTDAQKADMKDKDIELWEEKAMSGLLRNDAALSSLLTSMRSAFSTTIEGLGITPSSLGLNTGSYFENGKITVDTAKLRTALENNPDLVRNAFVQSSSGESGKFSSSGLIVRISDALLTYTRQATSGTLASLDKQISDSKSREDTLTTKLAARESMLWRKYTAMEKALSSLNSQSGWISSLFSTFGN